MCYVGKAKASRKIRVAEKDIKTFKFGALKNGKVIPYYKPSSGVIYNEGEEYCVEIAPYYCNHYSMCSEECVTETRVDAGLYSFAKSRAYHTVEKTGNYGNGVRRVVAYAIPKFLPFNSGTQFYNYDIDKLVLIECHIPKGAKYLMDWYGETVSEKLVVDKIIQL